MKRPSPAFISSLAFFLLGLLALVLTVKDKDFKDIGIQLIEANPFWICMVIAASVFGSLIRSLRWKQLLHTEGHNPPLKTVFASLLFGYMVNLGIPRLGEISRCAAMKKKTGISFNMLLGSVVAERVVDVLSLLLIILITLWAIFYRIESFMKTHVYPVVMPYLTVNVLLMTFSVALVAILMIYYFRHPIRQRISSVKWLSRFKAGILSIFHLPRPGLFMLYTGLIWLMYFFTSYFCFFALPGTAHLGADAGLALVAFGGIARSLPIQAGGFGAFHAVVVEVLFLFAVGESAALAVAILIHGLQFLYNLLFGAASALLLFVRVPVR